MQFFPILFAFFGLVHATALASTAGLEYLNMLREQAGLSPLRSHNALQQSAQAHSHYLNLHQITGHLEEESLEGFTGLHASDRAVAAGFESLAVSENVSRGQSDIYSSIDKLFGGIYHRFTFLDMRKDLIGIGVEARNYTFDLGNSYLDLLCRDHEYLGGPYYYNACSDREKRIESTLYDQAQNYYKNTSEAPEMVVWPPKNGTDILPGFYGENPDPLPEYAVSGYPVSVEFNDQSHPEAPDDLHIEMSSNDGQTLAGILIDSTNDPEERFTPYQFAFFPLEHLEWGTRYRVAMEFDGERREWCFSTRSLSSYGAQKVYRIDSNSPEKLEVVSGRTYALYFVPRDPKDQFERYHYRYNTQNPSISFIDRNTLLFTVSGETGQRVELTLDNPTDQNITLMISTSDQAEPPREDLCPQISSTPATIEENSYTTSTEYSTENLDSDQNESDVLQEHTATVSKAAGGSFSSILFLWSIGLIYILRRERLLRS